MSRGLAISVAARDRFEIKFSSIPPFLRRGKLVHGLLGLPVGPERGYQTPVLLILEERGVKFPIPRACKQEIIKRDAEVQVPVVREESRVQNDGISELDAKKQAFSEILLKLGKSLRNVYTDRLHWMWDMKKDPIHKKVMETRKRTSRRRWLR